MGDGEGGVLVRSAAVQTAFRTSSFAIDYIESFANMALSVPLKSYKIFSMSIKKSKLWDTGIWGGVTHSRLTNMRDECLVICVERDAKTYKEWILAVLKSQDQGALAAPPGYMARLNPTHVRTGVEPPTRDKYASAAGLLLAWGVQVQKVSFERMGQCLIHYLNNMSPFALPPPPAQKQLRDLPKRLPPDQGELLKWLIKIHKWLLWLTTNPLGATQLIEFLQVSLATWEDGTEGAVEGALQGGVFREITIPSASILLSGLQWVFKHTWAAEYSIMISRIANGFLVLKEMSEEEQKVLRGDMADR